MALVTDWVVTKTLHFITFTFLRFFKIQKNVTFYIFCFAEEVVLQLIKSKCVPVLLYGLEACALNKSQIASLDFVINRFFL